jgi:hypothetical protein
MIMTKKERASKMKRLVFLGYKAIRELYKELYPESNIPQANR